LAGARVNKLLGGPRVPVWEDTERAKEIEGVGKEVEAEGAAKNAMEYPISMIRSLPPWWLPVPEGTMVTTQEEREERGGQLAVRSEGLRLKS